MYIYYYEFKTISIEIKALIMFSLEWYAFEWYDYITLTLILTLIILTLSGEYACIKADRMTTIFLLVDDSLSNSDRPEVCIAFDKETKFMVQYMKNHTNETMSIQEKKRIYKMGLKDFDSQHPIEVDIISRYIKPYRPHLKSFRMDALGSLQNLFKNLRDIPNPIKVTVRLFSLIDEAFKATYAYKDKNIHIIEPKSILGNTNPYGGSPIYVGIMDGCKEILQYATNSNPLRILYYWLGLAPIVIFSIITDGEDDMDNPNPTKFSLKTSRIETLDVFKNMIKEFKSNYINLKIILNTTEVGSASLNIFNISDVTFNILKHVENVAHNFNSIVSRSITSAMSDSIATKCGIRNEERKDNKIIRSFFWRFATFYRTMKRFVKNRFTSNQTLLKNAFNRVGIIFNGYNIEDKDCSVCWEKYNNNQIFFGCGHSCCKSCLSEIHNKCPYCRQPVTVTLNTAIRSLTSSYIVDNNTTY